MQLHDFDDNMIFLLFCRQNS